MHADLLFESVEPQGRISVSDILSPPFSSSSSPAAPIFAIPIAKRARLSPSSNCSDDGDTDSYYNIMLNDTDDIDASYKQHAKNSRHRRHKRRNPAVHDGINMEVDDDESAALFGEDENEEADVASNNSSDDEDLDVGNKMREVGSVADTASATNDRIRDILSRHQSDPPCVTVPPVRLFRISTETWATGTEISATSPQTSFDYISRDSACYLPVLDPFHGDNNSFTKYKAVILDYNGTIAVDTFATWKSTLLAADATINHYRERICYIYNAKKRWLKKPSASQHNTLPGEETACSGIDGGANSNSDIFALTLDAIENASRSSMQDIAALRERMMLYDNPFDSFTCWRSCNPGSFEEYAEKAGMIDLLSCEEWNKNARSFMMEQAKMYRDFWVPRTSIPAPGLVSFVQNLERLKMPWFIVSLHPIEKIKSELGPLLQRAGALDMLPTFVDHVTPLQTVSPVRSRYECEISNHMLKGEAAKHSPHVYCRQDKVATIEKILDELLGKKNIEESDVLNVGDSILDLQVSLTLGMRFCGVHWGYCLRSTFKMNNAYVLPEYHDMSFLNAYADLGPGPANATDGNPQAVSPPRPPTPPSAPPLNTTLE